MKRGNNSGNDDFSFSTGGDEELFPLNVDNSSKKDTKAPKGVKGYLKNVAKSVVNLGVKTGKHMYPAAVELGEKFKPDTTSTTDPKAYIANWKAEAKKYGDIGKDIVKSTIKDAKEAVRTGKFVKTEEERNNAEEMFGDMFGESGFDFDGDSVSFDTDSDITGDDSNFDLSGDNDSPSAKLSTNETLIKTSYASARIGSQLSEKTNATIVGASQTQIKSDRAMFAQNLEISQEQHRQKMLLMSNIATNVGKIIEQGNVSIKAQMEFSAKQLAFSQDLAAMVKEVRDAQWKQVNPKQNKEINKSKFQKIFGSGVASSFNFSEFAKNFLNNSKEDVGGGILDTLGTGKEMIDMMLDMGGGASALKSMIDDMVFESVVDKFTSKRTSNGAAALNAKIEGLPGAFNRKLNSISENGAPELENLVRKLPFGLGNKLIDNKIIDFKSLAGWAHVDTDVKVKSDRFDMDPSEVHPFDNAAHKALTEVIPWQLAKIDAGINRTEQEIFNYKENKWEKISSVKKNIESARNEVLEYSNGYSDISERFEADVTEDRMKDSWTVIRNEMRNNNAFKNADEWSKDKVQDYVNLSKRAREYIVPNMKKIMHNIMMLGADYDMDQILASLLDKDSDNFDSFFTGLPTIPDGLSEEAVAFYIYKILREYQTTNPKEWISFQIDLANYKNKLTNANFESEEKYFGAGAGIAYDATIQDEIFDSNRKELNKKRDQLIKKKDSLLKLQNGKAGFLSKKLNVNEEISKIEKELKDLDETDKELSASEVNATTGILKTPSIDENTDKFVISDLNDSSTHGLVNNIYNLLLTGLDVYVKKPEGKQHELHDDIISHALTGVNGNASIKEAAFKASKTEAINSKANVSYIKLSGPNDSKALGHEIFKYNPGTMKYDHYMDNTKEVEDQYGDKSYVNSLTAKDFNNDDLYIKYSDLKKDTTLTIKSAKEELADLEKSYKNDEKEFEESIFGKIPGMKTVYKAFNGITQKVNDLGNKFLGENFYSEHSPSKFVTIDENSDLYKNKMTTEEREEYQKRKKELENAAEENKESLKADFDKFVKQIKESKGVKSLKFGANIVTSAFKRSDLSDATSALGKKLSNVKVKDKTLGEFVTETKNSELVSKLKNASNVTEQIQIVRDIGTDKAKSFADAAQTEYDKNKNKFDQMFKDKETGNFTLKNVKTYASDKIFKSLVSAQNKVLGSELMNLKDDKGTKLKEAVATINSKVLDAKLSKTSNPVEKAKILINSDYRELKSFKPNLEIFIEKTENELENSKSIKGILGNMKSKILNVGKEKIGGKLAAMNQNRILSSDLIKLKNKETGKTIGEIVSEINDPSLLSDLNSAKNVDDKINILLAYDKNKTLNKVKPDLIKFKKSIANRDTSFGGLAAWHKERSKENADKFIKNTLVKKLKKIKVNNKTLNEVLGEITEKDPSFGEKIESFTTMTDLAEFLLQSDNPKLKPYKKAIRELKDKHMDDEAQGGVAGIVGMGLVSGFDMIKKSIDAVKNLFNKRKKDANAELSMIEKYVHPDIVKLFGGAEATMGIMDGLGIDVELTFKDNENHKASKQIEIMLDANKSVKFLNGKQKRALKGLMRSELDKEAASSSINSIKSRISSINDGFNSEIEKYGKDMSSEDRKKIESMRDEELKSENRKLEKAEKRKEKASNKIKTAIGDEDSVEGNSAKEQREAKAKAKEDKAKAKEDKIKMGILSTLVTTLKDWKTKGLKLDDKTTENMKEAVSEGAAEGSKKGSSEGWSGKVSAFMDNTGLSKTKYGSAIKSALNKGGSAARMLGKNTKIASFLGKSKAGTAILTAAGKFGGGAVASGGAATVSGGMAAAGGGIGGTKGIVSILTKLFKEPKIAAKMGKTAGKSVIDAIKKGATKVMSKIFPKTVTLNGMASNWIGWVALAATAVTTFIKGMTNAKTTFNIGRGLRPTVGMRLACGLASMLDGVLLGIPGVICKAMGYRNAEEWFYSIVGKPAEKEALERYQKYNKMRSVIFGIDDPNTLVTYENRNLEKGGNFFDNLGAGAKRAGRAAANFLTFGLAKNNDEKDSALLGFQSVDIYKMWKEKKYIPLTTECVDAAIAKLREEKKDDEILKSMDDKKLKKYLEQMNAVSKEDLDNNDDGEVDENSKAQAEATALEHQNAYRKIYLEICREYVLKNGLAWLNSHCSLEKFKKHTGKDAKADLTKKERVKRAATMALNPMGLATMALQKKGAISEKEAKTVRKVAGAVTIGALVAGPLGALAVGTALVAKKAWKERKHIGRAIANAFRRGFVKNTIMEPFNSMERYKMMNPYKSTKKERTAFVKKLIEIIDKYGEGHIDEWKDLCNKLGGYDPKVNPLIGKQMAETFCKYANYKYTDESGNTVDMIKSTLGVEIPKDHPSRDNIAVASGMVGWVMEYMPEVDGMCQSIFGMTIKRLAVKVFVTGEHVAKASSNYDKYVLKRAEILGAPKEKIQAYEAGLKDSEKATGWGRFKAGFKSFFSKKDSDELDSKRIGFEDVKIYKYWKTHKYDPIINLEKRIAGKYGKYIEIIDKHCEDVEAQNKFITEFIREATKFVNENKLAWLTTKTTLKEFEEYERGGFQSNATIASEREKRRAQLENEMKNAKNSRQSKNIQKQLDRMDTISSGSISKNDINLQKDFDSLSQELMKNYKQDGLQAHEIASHAIEGFWEQAGIDFYGNQKDIEANPLSVSSEENGGPGEMFGAVGSNENLRILQEKVSENAKSVYNKAKQSASKTLDSAKTEINKYVPKLTDKIKSKVDVLSSPINDFVIGFKDELIKKLNILDEIHNEQVRHNNVSEDFYSAILNMVAIMAKSQGNTKMASQLDAMVKQVSK